MLKIKNLVVIFLNKRKKVFQGTPLYTTGEWFLMNKHNQKPTDMFNKQDVTVYLTYIKILKDLNILNFRLHIPEAIFKVL